MEYAGRLAWRVFAVFVYSGGWWGKLARALVIVAMVPAHIGFKQEARGFVSWITGIPAEQVPAWWFYMLGLCLAVVILAMRLAYVETTRVKFGALTAGIADGVTYLRLPARDISWREPKVVAYMQILDLSQQPIADAQNKVVLLTKERDERARAEGGLTKVGPFNLRREPKELEVARIDRRVEKIMVPHQNGVKELPFGDYYFRISIDGAGKAETLIGVSLMGGLLVFRNGKSVVTVVIGNETQASRSESAAPPKRKKVSAGASARRQRA